MGYAALVEILRAVAGAGLLFLSLTILYVGIHWWRHPEEWRRNDLN